MTAFIEQSANKALREGVLLRLARCNVVPADLGLLAPAHTIALLVTSVPRIKSGAGYGR